MSSLRLAFLAFVAFPFLAADAVAVGLEENGTPREECGVCISYLNQHWAGYGYPPGHMYSEGHGWHPGDGPDAWQPYTCTVTHGICVVVLEDGTEVSPDEVHSRLLDAVSRNALGEIASLVDNDRVRLSPEHNAVLVMGCDRKTVLSFVEVDAVTFNSLD